MPRPGMAETYGCPIWNSAKLKHTCLQKPTVPSPTVKNHPMAYDAAGWLMKKKKDTWVNIIFWNTIYGIK